MSLPSRSARLVLGIAAVVAGMVTAVASAGAQQPEPYEDPPFACEVIDFGSEPPTIPGPADDPLCVRYDKTNATVSDLQALDFLAAEPGRIGLVAVPPRCAYWQQDHWIVRLDPSLPPVVSWRGSYWYDASSGAGGAVMRDLQVGGVPVAADAFIDAIAALIGPEQAEALRAFTDPGGGGGVSFALPDGVGLGCRAAPDPSDELAAQPTSPGPASAPTSTTTDSLVAARAAAPGTLPVTGAPVGLATPLALVAVALLTTSALRRSSVDNAPSSPGS